MDPSFDRDPIEQFADSFVARWRAGQRPSIEEYAARYPELADEIYELLPTLVQLEQTSSGDVRANDPASAISDQIGEFSIVRKIGQGGMGIVYEAVQQSLGRRVALKVLSTRGLANSQLDRFRQEARAAAHLSHTNIVPVYGVGEQNGIHYYVMQLISGRSLDQMGFEIMKLRRRSYDSAAPKSPITPIAENDAFRFDLPNQGSDSIPSDRLTSVSFDTLTSGATYYRNVARLGLQVATALAYAHSQGIIHRDIKPSNLILDAYGTVWVTDFGLAKFVEADGLTHTGDIVGTLRYMAPERLDGWSDPRSDVYGLGATMYELLAFRPLFPSENRAKLVNHILRDQPTPIRKHDPLVAKDLATIIDKTLAKEPGDRYTTADQLAEDLRNFLDGRPISARRSRVVERFGRFCRRNPNLALLGSIVVLLLAVITVGSSIAASRFKVESAVARSAQKLANESVQLRRQELVAAYLAQARSAPSMGTVGQRLQGTQAIRSVMSTLPWNELTSQQHSDLVDAAVACLTRPDVDEIQRRQSYSKYSTYDHRDVAIDSEFQFLARPTANHGETTVIDSLSDGAAAAESPLRESSSSPAVVTPHNIIRRFSPHGRWLLEIIPWFTNSPHPSFRLRVWDWKSQKVAVDYRSDQSSCEVAFHPDEQHLLISGRDARLRLLDIASGEIVGESPERFRASHPVYRPDGKCVAIASSDLPAELVDPDNWQTVATFPQIGKTRSAAWSLDGRILAFAASEDGAYVCQPQSDLPGFFLEFGNLDASDVALSPDGRVLAVSGMDGSCQVWNTERRQLLISIPGQALRFSQNGRELAIVDGDHLVVYDLVECLSYRAIQYEAETADFSPDGRWLGVSGRFGSRLLDAERLTLAADLGLDSCGPLTFHPDGGSVTTFGTFSHLWTWPLGKQDGDYCVGPPEISFPQATLVFHQRWPAPHHRGRRAAWSADGRVFAAANNRHHQLFVAHRDTGMAPMLIPFPNISSVALSPSGRWVAGFSDITQRSVVIDTTDGHEVFDLDDSTNSCFSTDGQRLAVRSQNRIRLFHVPSWRLERQMETEQLLTNQTRLIAFQPGGRLLASTDRSQRIRLYDCETASLVITLDGRESSMVKWISFSPDGTRLAVTRSNCIVVWDLLQLGIELHEMGLRPERLCDSSGPAITEESSQVDRLIVNRGPLPAPKSWYRLWQTMSRDEALQRKWPDAIDDLTRALDEAPIEDVAGRVELLTERGEYYRRNRNFQAARVDWQNALELSPVETTAALHLARLLVLGPPDVQDPNRSRALAQEFKAQGSTDPVWDVLLGMANLRLGEKTGAKELLSATDADEWQTLIAYFRVLDYDLHAENELARRCFADAVERHHRQLSSMADYQAEELDRLRAEIELLFQSDAVPNP